MKGFTPLRAAAVRCVNSYQEPEEDDEAGWVLSQKIRPLLFSFQLFIKAQCKGPDTRPAWPGCCDLCDTQAAVEPVMRDLLLNGQLSSRCLPNSFIGGRDGGVYLYFDTSSLNEEENKQKMADDKCSN